MISREKSKKDLIKAVLTVLLGLGVLGLFIVGLGGDRFWEDLDPYVVKLRNVKNLRPNRPVKYAGIGVGRVLGVRVDQSDPGMVVVDIGLEEGFALYNGTVASISQQGLVGDNFVLLELDGKAGGRLPVGATIPGRDIGDFNELAKKMSLAIDSLRPKLEEAVDNVNKILGDELQTKLHGILDAVPPLLDQAEGLLATVDTELAGVSGSARQGIADARLLVADGRRTLAVLDGSLNATMDDLRLTVNAAGQEFNKTMNATRAQVNMVGGSVHRLTEDLAVNVSYDQERLESILDNIEALTEDMRLLVRSLRERPWQVIHKPEAHPAPLE